MLIQKNRTAEDVRHYRITRSNGQVYVSTRHQFSTIAELIAYHLTNRGGLFSRLKHPVPRINQPAVTSLARDKWEIDREELTIGQKLGSGQFGVSEEYDVARRCVIHSE